MLMRYWTRSLALIACSLLPLIVGCGHEHVWRAATCTEPATCEICNETEGKPLGHTWEDATCTEPKTCSVCGETDGEALGHDWAPATHEKPKTCVRCGKEEGSPLLYDVTEGLVDGYQFGEFDTYNSYASENGLGDTLIWFNGVYDAVSTMDLPEVKDGLQVYTAIVADEEGHDWLIQLDLNEFGPIEKYTDLQGHQLCILGLYQGYSDVYEMPAIMMEQMFDRTTGSLISSTWFSEL